MRLATCVAVCLMGVCGAALRAQQQKPIPPPPEVETPNPQLAPIPEPIAGDALYSPLATPGAESLRTRWNEYLVLTWGPRALISPMLSSALALARPNYNYPNNWHQGMQGFGRQYGSRIGTKAAYETTRFAVAAALHEDFRYRPATTQDFFGRVGHAVGFAFVDRSASGRPMLAISNLTAAAAGGFTENLWLPDGFNDWQHGGTRMGTKMGGIVIQNEFREFAPEIFKGLHALHLPFPRLPVPDWWDKNIQIADRPGRRSGRATSLPPPAPATPAAAAVQTP